MNVTMATPPATTTTPGVAGRTNYAQWDKLATDLVDQAEAEEQEEVEQQKAALGLDGKYASSQSEADERTKAAEVLKTKQMLDQYKQREEQAVQRLSALLGPVPDDPAAAEEETKSTDQQVIRITRNQMDAGKRVVSISDTSGTSQKHSTIVLTRDLSLLESQMAAPNTRLTPKSYEGDAENDAPDLSPQQPRFIYGLIKVFISNVHHCTIRINCKIITGTVELHHCSNVKVRIEDQGTVATLQADGSENITIEFDDAPSGKNSGLPGQPRLYWGDDADDRIFHAGVSGMTVRVLRDGICETETVADYRKDGAVAIGNASAEEMQFITSVVNGQLLTEKAARNGSSTGKNTRAMTERELQQEEARRAKAADMAIAMAESMIKIKDKDGNEIAKKTNVESVVEEPKSEVDMIVAECEDNKAKGNEAFGNGEYAQAILLYSLALDKADELPDDKNSLFPRDIVYSNRAACFLKLGEHQKALEDAERALEINPENIKATFRRGLSLHALGRYGEALPVLSKARDMQPKNKQIQQALQFAEVRFEQENRKRAGR